MAGRAVAGPAGAGLTGAGLTGAGYRAAGKRKGSKAGRSLPYDPFPSIPDFMGAGFMGTGAMPVDSSDHVALSPLILEYGTSLLIAAARAIELGVVRAPALEYDDQVLVFRFLDHLARRFPADLGDEIVDIFSTSSGGKRHRGAAGQLKLAGQRRGVPDIEAWCPRIAPDGSILHGLAIEMKRTPVALASGWSSSGCPSSGRARKSGRGTPEQRERIERLRRRGYQAEILHGWRPTCVALMRYLTLRRP